MNYLSNPEAILAPISPEDVFRLPEYRNLRDAYGDHRSFDKYVRPVVALVVQRVQALPPSDGESFSRARGYIDQALLKSKFALALMRDTIVFFTLPLEEREREIERIKVTVVLICLFYSMLPLILSFRIVCGGEKPFHFGEPLADFYRRCVGKFVTLERNFEILEEEAASLVKQVFYQNVPQEVLSFIRESSDRTLMSSLENLIAHNWRKALRSRPLMLTIEQAELMVNNRDLALRARSGPATSAAFGTIMARAIIELFSEELTRASSGDPHQYAVIEGGSLFLTVPDFFNLLRSKLKLHAPTYPWDRLNLIKCGVESGLFELDHDKSIFTVAKEIGGRKGQKKELLTVNAVRLIKGDQFLAPNSDWYRALQSSRSKCQNKAEDPQFEFLTKKDIQYCAQTLMGRHFEDKTPDDVLIDHPTNPATMRPFFEIAKIMSAHMNKENREECERFRNTHAKGELVLLEKEHQQAKKDDADRAKQYAADFKRSKEERTDQEHFPQLKRTEDGALLIKNPSLHAPKSAPKATDNTLPAAEAPAVDQTAEGSPLHSSHAPEPPVKAPGTHGAAGSLLTDTTDNSQKQKPEVHAPRSKTPETENMKTTNNTTEENIATEAKVPKVKKPAEPKADPVKDLEAASAVVKTTSKSKSPRAEDQEHPGIFTRLWAALKYVFNPSAYPEFSKCILASSMNESSVAPQKPKSAPKKRTSAKTTEKTGAKKSVPKTTATKKRAKPGLKSKTSFKTAKSAKDALAAEPVVETISAAAAVSFETSNPAPASHALPAEAKASASAVEEKTTNTDNESKGTVDSAHSVEQSLQKSENSTAQSDSHSEAESNTAANSAAPATKSEPENHTESETRDPENSEMSKAQSSAETTAAPSGKSKDVSDLPADEIPDINSQSSEPTGASAEQPEFKEPDVPASFMLKEDSEEDVSDELPDIDEDEEEELAKHNAPASDAQGQSNSAEKTTIESAQGDPSAKYAKLHAESQSNSQKAADDAQQKTTESSKAADSKRSDSQNNAPAPSNAQKGPNFSNSKAPTKASETEKNTAKTCDPESNSVEKTTTGEKDSAELQSAESGTGSEVQTPKKRKRKPKTASSSRAMQERPQNPSDAQKGTAANASAGSAAKANSEKKTTPSQAQSHAKSGTKKPSSVKNEQKAPNASSASQTQSQNQPSSNGQKTKNSGKKGTQSAQNPVKGSNQKAPEKTDSKPNAPGQKSPSQNNSGKKATNSDSQKASESAAGKPGGPKGSLKGASTDSKNAQKTPIPEAFSEANTKHMPASVAKGSRPSRASAQVSP